MSTQDSSLASGPRDTQVVRDQNTTGPARRATLVAWACLLIVYVVWGSTYLAIRIGVETIPPLLLAAARNLMAGVIMFPLALRARRARPAAPFWPSRAQWAGCATVGILLLVANGIVGVGERTVPSGLAALLVATVPLWLLGMDAGLNHARLGLAPVAGLALGLAGVALLSGLGGGTGRVSVGGVLTILAAAAMWALGTIMARRVTMPSSPALASGMELLCGGAVLLALAAAAGEFSSLRLGEVSARSWLALGYLTVVGSIVAFSAYGIAVRALPTATVATYAYVNPVIAVLLGALILSERLTPAMFGGGALVVGAVVLVVRRRPAAQSRPASSTATMPVRNTPSKVPAPPMDTTGAPRRRTLGRLTRSAANSPGSSAGTAMPSPGTGRATACTSAPTMTTAASACQPIRSCAIRYPDTITGSSAPPTLTAMKVLRLVSTGTMYLTPNTLTVRFTVMTWLRSRATGRLTALPARLATRIIRAAPGLMPSRANA